MSISTLYGGLRPTQHMIEKAWDNIPEGLSSKGKANLVTDFVSIGIDEDSALSSVDISRSSWYRNRGGGEDNPDDPPSDEETSATDKKGGRKPFFSQDSRQEQLPHLHPLQKRTLVRPRHRSRPRITNSSERTKSSRTRRTTRMWKHYSARTESLLPVKSQRDRKVLFHLLVLRRLFLQLAQNQQQKRKSRRGNGRRLPKL